MDQVLCPGGGALLLTAFPGLADAAPANTRAAIQLGLGRIAAAGATMLVTLVEPETLTRLDAPDYGDLVRAAGLVWRHFPIRDFSVPDDHVRARWRDANADLHQRLDAGETIAIHCRAGLGRTGVAAAMILIERGLAPDQAIRLVRRSRPGAIETAEQQDWVAAYRGARPNA